jgi:WD40 repeat protein
VRQLFRERLPAHAAAIAFSPDSGLLGIGTAEGDVLLWRARDGRQQRPPIPIAGGAIQGISFSPDGRLFAVTAYDPTATLWDLRSRKRIGNSFPIHQGAVPEPLFEPNGRLLLTYLSDGVEWPVDVHSWERSVCRVAGRDLTRNEWNDLLPNRPYRRVCR